MERFLFRLCLALGYRHPRYLVRDLNARDIAEWMAYSLIEPWGAQHDEVLAGIIAAEIFNNTEHRPGTQARKATDYMPSYTPDPMTEDQIHANLLEWKTLAGK